MPPSPTHCADSPGRHRLVESIHAALPQTQCTRCGFPDCLGYAEAIAADQADINRCPPGGSEGVARLSWLTGLAAKPLDPEHGREGPRALALIDESWCIGCTLCIKACPVDCIVGAPKRMHTVIEAQCTGCELCVPVCPVDCISMHPASGSRTGWQAWSGAEARTAHDRHAARGLRLAREQTENDARLAARAQARLDQLSAHGAVTDPAVLAAKRAVIEAALSRATPAAPAQRGPGGHRSGAVDGRGDGPGKGDLTGDGGGDDPGDGHGA